MNDLFWITVSCIKGIGSKTFINLYKNEPDLNFNNVKERLHSIDNKRIAKLLTMENIEIAQEKAEHLIRVHEENDMKVISILSEWYPTYLRLIKDPPTVLYAKGNVELLKKKQQLAIVGTRKPTEMGVKSARKIAQTFAEMGYTIVSGLALGIDTAGHEGALQAKDGTTIAVLAGNLLDIYPEKNKQLAMDILERNGLWLSETPIGEQNTRGNFVKRNRIQSGLSLGVCPVQTPLKSGTQHTIKFAKEQKRFLFTPIPLKQDENEPAIEGNLALIKDGIPVLENKASYESIHDTLFTFKQRLNHEHQERFE